jgi:pimeloyl-ACP methyl ester carboxylesterase
VEHLRLIAGELQMADVRNQVALSLFTDFENFSVFKPARFDRTTTAFTNPDYVSIMIHNYRWRLSLADGDPRYDGLKKRLAKSPTIGVPTLTLDGERDPFTPPGAGERYRAMFTGKYAHRTLRGIGHNVPQEAPEAFAEAVIEVDGF